MKRISKYSVKQQRINQLNLKRKTASEYLKNGLGINEISLESGLTQK